MLKDSVIIFDKTKQIHRKKKIFRSYLSCGKIPAFDPAHKKSYMFSDNIDAKSDIIPLEYRKYVDQIKKLDTRYNQFVINFYKNGEEYIEPHSDCDKNMVDNYRILILSLGETRTLRFTSRLNNDIKFDVLVSDKSIFLLDKDLNSKYRHEILKDNSLNLRISITARMIK